MRMFSVLAEVLFAGSAAALSLPALDARDGVALPVAAAKSVLNQCSRDAPQHIQAIWAPRQKEIAQLEMLLPSALFAVTSTFRVPYRPPEHYRRQYIGILVGGQKLIYVNAFPHETANGGNSSAQSFDWRKQAVVVCDGGPPFFGMEYDPATRKFDHFEFNGNP